MGKQAYLYVSGSRTQFLKNLEENSVSKSEKTEGGQEPAQELMEVTCSQMVMRGEQETNIIDVSLLSMDVCLFVCFDASE